jgi:hypothetical protein
MSHVPAPEGPTSYTFEDVDARQESDESDMDLGAPHTPQQVPPAPVGTCYLHRVIDDHSRVAYVEPDDETKEARATASGCGAVSRTARSPRPAA